LLFSLINPGRILYGLWQKTLTIPWFFCSKSYYDPTKPWLHTSSRIQGILDMILILRNSKPVQILLNRTSYLVRILSNRGYTLLSGKSRSLRKKQRILARTLLYLGMILHWKCKDFL